jgi:hypothetical protein
MVGRIMARADHRCVESVLLESRKRRSVYLLSQLCPLRMAKGFMNAKYVDHGEGFNGTTEVLRGHSIRDQGDERNPDQYLGARWKLVFPMGMA